MPSEGGHEGTGRCLRAGIISLGLAEAIVPGELYGIDMEQSQVDLAIEAARQGGHGNAHF